jgi:hypothetical protein
MFSSKFTASEMALIDRLPKPPAFSKLWSTHVWIIEWLSADERRTGKELHDWMEQGRPGWSIYNRCTTKEEVILSIEQVAYITRQSDMVPILHIEAHGSEYGIASSRDTQEELLTWEELIIPFQMLNFATKCNLIVVVAACLGVAAIQALSDIRRAPAVAVVGTDSAVNESDLLLGIKEFYRPFKDEEEQNLTDIIESASREMSGTNFEIGLFITLAYYALIKKLFKEIRSDKYQERLEILRLRRHQETSFSSEELERLLDEPPEIAVLLQQIWDAMFMIDLYPNNNERFGLNWDEITSQVFANSVG